MGRLAVLVSVAIALALIAWQAFPAASVAALCESGRIAEAGCWAVAVAGEALASLDRSLKDHLGSIAAVAVVAVAASTVLSWRATRRLFKATHEAADAAKRTADALIGAERAHLSVVIKRHNLDEVMKGAIRYPNSPEMDDYLVDAPAIDFVFKNYGRTPAILVEFAHHLVQRADAETPAPLPASDEISATVIDGGGGESDLISCRLAGPPFTLGAAKAALSRRAPLVFEGHAVFADAFERSYVLRWRHENRSVRFRLTRYDERQRVLPR